MSEGTGYLGPDDVARSRIQATSVPAGGGEVGGGEGTVPPVAWLALARGYCSWSPGPLDRRGRRFKLINTTSTPATIL
jgi:hypothetical protein